MDGTGSACPPTCGPDSAAPSDDGTWFVLDGSHNRVVHLDSTGRYLDQIPLASGVEQLHRLSDGTLVAVAKGSALLVVPAGERARTVTVQGLSPVGLNIAYTDGPDLFMWHADVITKVRFSPDYRSAELDAEQAPVQLRFELGHADLVSGEGVGVRLTFPSSYLITGRLTPLGAAGWALLLSGSDAQTPVNALIRLDGDGNVTQQSGVDLSTARSTYGPSLRSVPGRLLLALPRLDGLDLYAERLPDPTPPAGGQSAGVEPAQPKGAAGGCNGPGPRSTAGPVRIDVVTADGVPVPRCAKVDPRQWLRLVNRSWLPAGVRVGRFAFTLQPGQAHTIEADVGSYLARGSHHIRTRVLGTTATGGEVIVL